MADSIDLELLKSGELDLSRCDFRDAKLDGMDLRGRNFSHTLFERASCEGTRFDGSDFQGAQVSFIKAKNAVFDGCKLLHLHFGYADLQGASFKGAVADRTRFQHAKLDGANLEGTLMRGGAIDADTTLIDAFSDEDTDFEGLQVLRPTSRDPLFKDYDFDKGKLHLRTRNAGSAEANTPNKMLSDSLKGQPESSAKKRSQVPPPAFPESVGEAEFNYSNYDGRAVIGEGQTAFETRWSNASNSSINVYNDPSEIRGIAIAPEATSPEEVTVASIAGLDFSSRIRKPREGQVVVFENTAGRYLAVQIVDVFATSHGDNEDRLVLRYAVVPTNEKAAQLAEVVNLAKTAEDSLLSLRPDATSSELRNGGIGHNNPPELTPIETDEFDEAIDALRAIRREAAQDTPDKAEIVRSKNKISTVAKKIVIWVGQKCDLAAEEFARQIGKTLGDAKFLAAAWLALSGRLDQLLAAIDIWLPF